MLQGTASHVGKTVLVAGLCRLLHNRGVRVAPFKAQNMALNAAVTPGGGEIGWAQAIQAEAAGVEPSVDMNPILLKPQTSPGGGARAQVVVGGKVWATLGAAEYQQRHAELSPVVADAFARLAAAHDAIVIEGAGSPAEPNLLAVDLVNMAVARLARAPVVLVGDIDRGGVFASFLGIRKGQAMRRDAVTIRPQQVIVVAVVLVVLFVISLIVIVRIIIRAAGA